MMPLRNRRGSVTILGSLMLLCLIGFCGLAIDGGRYWLVRNRLRASMDAAALVAARQISVATRDADAIAAFKANFTPPGAAGPFLGALATTPTVTPVGTTQVQLKASADVRTTVMAAFKALGLLTVDTVTLNVTSVAERAGTGLEVALVLDSTYSMAFTDSSTGGTKLAAAQAAVHTLLDILYGTTSDTQPNLWVSVVPFSVAINIGANRSSWLTGTAPTYTNGYSWSGCVEMRQGNEDVSESSPVTAPFTRYFWPSTWSKVGSATTKCTANRSYGAGLGNNYCWGDNDWGTPANLVVNNPIITQYGPYGASFGPNAWCPARAITPLTASKASVSTAVNGMTAPFGLGTMLPAGLQAGWFTLSPLWRSSWNILGGTGGPALPLDYGLPNRQKAIVLLSDGDNNWYAPDFLPNRAVSATLPDSLLGPYIGPEFAYPIELFYSGYGRLSNWQAQGRSPTIPVINAQAVGHNLRNDYNSTQALADAALDSRTKTLCDNIKRQGILIYVIGFEVVAGSNADTLLQYCASGPFGTYYFRSPNAAALQASFGLVANQLSSLRLVR